MAKIITLRLDVWKMSTLALFIALILVIFQPGLIGRFAQPLPALSAEEVAQRCIDYINTNLVQPGTRATLVSVEEVDGLYKIVTSYQGRQIDVYATQDGKLMFLQAFDLTQPIEVPAPAIEFDAPDAERPQVDLFVMSFCPFGNVAEDAMLPVVDLLADHADFRLRFIVNVNTQPGVRSLEIQTAEGVFYIDSLHGANEAWQDAIEVCVQQYYDAREFWSFVSDVNNECTPIYRDLEQLNECWQTLATEHGFDVQRIESCAESMEVIDLFREDESLAEQWGVRGSPTLIINGARYQGDRSPEAFKQAVCSGFLTTPTECEQSLSAEVTAPTGGC